MDAKVCTERKRPTETERPCQQKRDRREWKKPVLEDVSGKVMAQPYIRFT